MDSKIIGAFIVWLAIVLVGANNIYCKPYKNSDKVFLLKDEPAEPASEATEKDEEVKKEDVEKKEEFEEEEDEELDYELGKINPQTHKAIRYICKGCGEVMLEPFRCEICEMDAEKDELEVEERKGKWYIKGTSTMVVEKEPDEQEEAPAEEEGKPKKEEEENSSPKDEK